jgi:hypothetical protein
VAKLQRKCGKFAAINAANIQKTSGNFAAKKQQNRGKFAATTW